MCAAPQFDVAAAVTQPDRPKGRDLKLAPPPVKVEASRWNLLVLQPERARRPEFHQQLTEIGPDLIVVAAYGQILPVQILELPRFGCLNIHTSLLPKYRGAAPIQWAILNGDTETGVTIMKMDAGLDTGDIVAEERTPIHDSDTAQTLHDRLATLGADLLIRTIPEFVRGKTQSRKQPEHGASYARKITKEDGRLKWTSSARSLWNQVRGLVPWPGAYTRLKDGNSEALIKIWAADPIESEPAGASAAPGEIVRADRSGIVVACGEGALRIKNLQREGGRRLEAHAFLAGHPLAPGQRFD